MHMKFRLDLFSLIFLVVITGCSVSSTVAPDSIPGISIQNQTINSGSRYLIGFWDVSVDKHLNVSLTPSRSIGMHFNAVRMLEEAPCTDCLSIGNVTAPQPGQLSVDLTIRHPFPSNLNLTGFDVRGVFITDGDYSFPASGRVVSWDNTYPILLNADGYTALYNPTEFPSDSPLPPVLKYYPGKFSPVPELTSNLNPYVAYFETAPRRMFLPGMEKTEQVIIDLPDGPMKFGYAVDMSWSKPGGTVIDPVNEFPIEANSIEAYQITSSISEPLTDTIGSTTLLSVGVYDHQGQATITDVVAEAPDLFENTHSLLPSGQITDDGWLYTIEIPNTNGAPIGTVPLLIKVNDSATDPNLGSIEAWGVMGIEIIEGVTEPVGWALTSELETSWCNEIVADGNGYVYLTGTQFAALKVDLEGNIIWRYEIVGGFPVGDGIDLDPDGNILVTGIFSDEADFDGGLGSDVHYSNGPSDSFLIKIDNDGNYVWGVNWGGELTGDNGYYECGFGVAVDDNNDIFCTGHFRGLCDFDPGPGLEEISSNGHENGGFDTYLTSFDSSGEFRWVQTWGSDEIGPSNNPKMGERPCGIAIDGQGDVYVTGGFSGTVDFDPGPGVDERTSITAYGDVLLIKWSPDGAYKWVRTWPGIGYAKISALQSSGFSGKKLCIDSLDNVLVKSIYDGPVDLDPGPSEFLVSDDGAALTKFDQNGNTVWIRTWSGYDFFKVFGSTLCVDSLDNIYTGGAYQWTLDLDPGVDEDIRWGHGFRDAWLVKLTQDGDYIWGNAWGPEDSPDMNFCESWDACVDEFDNVYSCGFFTGTVDFDPDDTIDSHYSEMWSGFLVKYSPSGTW